MRTRISVLGNKDEINRLFVLMDRDNHLQITDLLYPDSKNIAIVSTSNKFSYYKEKVKNLKIDTHDIFYFDTKILTTTDIYYYLKTWPKASDKPLIDKCNNSRYLFGDKISSVIRSSSIYDLSPKGLSRLKAYSIKTAIDLRQHGNINISHELGLIGIDYFKIPLTTHNGVFYNTQIDSYFALIENHLAIKKILICIMKAKKNLLIFCKYGNDRTGIISFLLGLIIDWKEEDIIMSYVMSQYYDQRLRKNISGDTTHYDFQSFTKASTVIELIKRFRKKYLTINNYLEIIGLSNDVIDVIRKKYKGIENVQ
jgi:protein tyrosine/serine phosphatase